MLSMVKETERRRGGKPKLPPGKSRVVVSARVNQRTKLYIEAVARKIKDPSNQNCGRAIDMLVEECVRARLFRVRVS